MKKGFTLVELLIVMAIMGILTTIAVSQFQTAKRKANDVARKGDLNAVAKALQMYYADYGKMPEVDSSGQIVVNGTSIAWGGEFKDASGYIYMKQLPIENKTGMPPYCYKTDGKAYALFVMLENTQDSQCISGATYRCGDPVANYEYCFAYYSPNISLNNDGSFK